MKPWLLYIVLAWQVGPLLPEEQKTIIIQFDSPTECRSVAMQVAQQTKEARSIFYLKGIECKRCIEVGDKRRCRPTAAPKALKK